MMEIIAQLTTVWPKERTQLANMTSTRVTNLILAILNHAILPREPAIPFQSTAMMEIRVLKMFVNLLETVTLATTLPIRATNPILVSHRFATHRLVGA